MSRTKRSTGEPYLASSSRPKSVPALVITPSTPKLVSVCGSKSCIVKKNEKKSSKTEIITKKKKSSTKVAKQKTKKSKKTSLKGNVSSSKSSIEIGRDVTEVVKNSNYSLTEDVNCNSIPDKETFEEQLSRDIAQAVASIVAEYELYNNSLESPDDKSDLDDDFPCDSDHDEERIKAGCIVKANESPNLKYQLSGLLPSMQEIMMARPITIWSSPQHSALLPPLQKTSKKDGKSEGSETSRNNIVTTAEPSSTTQSFAVVSSAVSSSTKTKVSTKKKKVKKSGSGTPVSGNLSASVVTLKGTKGSYSSFSPPTPSRGAKMGSLPEVLFFLGRIQKYINHLGYHQEGEPEIRINYRLSMKMQMVTAKEIIRSGSRIKCLHAVVLAVYFTNNVDTVERFPIYFRSQVQTTGREYKHIVLGIYVQGHFGALGISRDDGLQDKKIEYTKLSDLIFEYKNCYSESGHVLSEVKFGSVITHDQHSVERLFSKTGTVPIVGRTVQEIEANVEKHARQLKGAMGPACLRPFRLHSSGSFTIPHPTLKISRSSLSSTNLLLNANSRNYSDPLLFHRVRPQSTGPISSRVSSEITSNKNTLRARTKPPKTKR